ncbi:MAG: His/Gly/Thr/Pro-type tRNA ligase C-terminal domain-containing protein, partial [Rubrivivax sp.]
LEAAGLNPPSSAPDAYAIVADGVPMATVMPVLEALRAAGAAVVLHAGGGSLKSQFKRADASGARHALIFAPDELARGELALKPLRDAAAPQRTRSLADAARWASELLPA